MAEMLTHEARTSPLKPFIRTTIPAQPLACRHFIQHSLDTAGRAGATTHRRGIREPTDLSASARPRLAQPTHASQRGKLESDCPRVAMPIGTHKVAAGRAGCAYTEAAGAIQYPTTWAFTRMALNRKRR